VKRTLQTRTHGVEFLLDGIKRLWYAREHRKIGSKKPTRSKRALPVHSVLVAKKRAP